jgi:ribonuclease P protein component
LHVQRLKTRAQFQAVMAAGIAARTAHFALHRMPIPGSEASAVGVVLPKRWAKRAVTRNTIKRQVYQVSEAATLPAAAYVVRLRVAFERAQFPSATSVALKRAVRDELMQLFAQAALKAAA